MDKERKFVKPFGNDSLLFPVDINDAVLNFLGEKAAAETAKYVKGTESLGSSIDFDASTEESKASDQKRAPFPRFNVEVCDFYDNRLTFKNHFRANVATPIINSLQSCEAFLWTSRTNNSETSIKIVSTREELHSLKKECLERGKNFSESPPFWIFLKASLIVSLKGCRKQSKHCDFLEADMGILESAELGPCYTVIMPIQQEGCRLYAHERNAFYGTVKEPESVITIEKGQGKFAAPVVAFIVSYFIFYVFIGVSLFTFHFYSILAYILF